MAKTMTAPQHKTMTDGQIDDLVNKLRDAVRKHRDELGSEAVQKVLGTDNLGMILFDPFRRLVEMVSTMFTRSVSGINRDQSPQAAINATGRMQYTNRSVVDAMPRGEGEDAELEFFELDYDPTPAELDAEYKSRNLKADPFALCKHMQDDPTFADERPVACQWDLKEDGAACYAAFHRWLGEWNVSADRSADVWHRGYRYAGVRK